MGIQKNIGNSCVLWRYMDLSKLLAILVDESIAFPRIDKFDDLYEGYANNYLELAKKSYMNNPFMKKHSDGHVETGLIRNLIKILNVNSYVSCWHMNDYESAAMWKLYCKSSDSMVIKTTVGKLKLALTQHINELDYGGVIYDFEYKDVSKLDHINLSDPLFTKRNSFEHEKEFRVIFRNYESFKTMRSRMETDYMKYMNSMDHGYLSDDVIKSLESGLYYDSENGRELGGNLIIDGKSQLDPVVNLSIDPSLLIEEIIISPDSPDWFVNTVKSTIDMLGYDFLIRKSDLNTLN
ncbi:hypothetical protein KVY11_01045 [Acinetobacter sp. CWB-G5]|uniref:DUF2971 domain-containing protein n=1 Tax=Acinetobacter sp. CWB-G5 TaxID=2855444 RepID=UPI001C47B87D|nr:hypothetical protein [Acinetobacter sp. CWB-G5]MBV7307282.1 hypothetical protein [Acinetobacter sp. CWB-G5]